MRVRKLRRTETDSYFCFRIKLKTHSQADSAHGDCSNFVIINYTHRGTGQTAVHKYSITQIPRLYLQISRITIIPQFSQRWSIELGLSHWLIDKPTLCGDNTSPKRHKTYMKILRENYFYWNQAILCPLRLRIIYWNQFAWNVAGLAVAVRTQYSSIHHQSVHNWNRLKNSTRIYHIWFLSQIFFISASCLQTQTFEAILPSPKFGNEQVFCFCLDIRMFRSKQQINWSIQ